MESAVLVRLTDSGKLKQNLVSTFLLSLKMRCSHHWHLPISHQAKVESNSWAAALFSVEALKLYFFNTRLLEMYFPLMRLKKKLSHFWIFSRNFASLSICRLLMEDKLRLIYFMIDTNIVGYIGRWLCAFCWLLIVMTTPVCSWQHEDAGMVEAATACSAVKLLGCLLNCCGNICLTKNASSSLKSRYQHESE